MEAFGSLTQLVAAHGVYPYYIETRGFVLFRMGRLDEALQLIRRAVARIPNDPDTQRDLKEVEAAIRLRRGVAAAASGAATK